MFKGNPFAIRRDHGFTGKDPKLGNKNLFTCFNIHPNQFSCAGVFGLLQIAYPLGIIQVFSSRTKGGAFQLRTFCQKSTTRSITGFQPNRIISQVGEILPEKPLPIR